MGGYKFISVEYIFMILLINGILEFGGLFLLYMRKLVGSVFCKMVYLWCSRLMIFFIWILMLVMFFVFLILIGFSWVLFLVNVGIISLVCFSLIFFVIVNFLFVIIMLLGISLFSKL